MSVNRFRRIVPVLDPTMYRFQERLQLPDLTGIGQVASALQTSYDTKIPRPQHIQKDAPLVDQYFVKPVEGLKSKAIDAFKSGDTSQGINYMKQMEQFIYNAKQPGGAYNAFEDNYKRAQDYIKSTTDNKDIAKDTKDFSISKSLGNFTTFDEAGNRQVFQGYTPAKDVDLNDYFTKLTKDWAETEWVKGYSKTLGGQYFDQRTGKKVSKAEIVNSLRESWLNNPDIKPYIEQLTEMVGKEKAYERVNSAINLAAEKEAFESETSKLVGNKEYDISGQIRVARAKKDMENEGQTTTIDLAPFQYNPIPKGKVDVKDGRIQTMIVTPTPSAKNIGFGNYGGAGVNAPQPVYEDKGFNQLLTDPKYKSYFNERPGLETIVKMTPATGMNQKDYNTKVAKMYESLVKNGGNSLQLETVTPSDMKTLKTTMLGDGKEGVGAIMNNTVWALSKDAPPHRLTLSEIEAAKDNILFYGISKGGNGYYPGALFGTYKDAKDRNYSLVVEPINRESAIHYEGLKTLMQPTSTHIETGWRKVLIPGQGYKTIKVKPNLIFDAKGNYMDTELEFYNSEDGGKTSEKLNWTKETLHNYFDQSASQLGIDQIRTTSAIK